MKHLFILSAICSCSLLFSCKKEAALEPSKPPAPDYVLPQGKSPADSRIVDLYNRYGTYFLYDFTQSDFYWNQVGRRLSGYKAKSGDPQYAGQMLDLLGQTWFRFYPDAFLKQKMPYKVFLADSLRLEFSPTFTVLTNVSGGTDNIAVGYVNSSLSGKDATFKLNFKSQLNLAFLQQLMDSKKILPPSKFYDVSTYSANTVTTVADANFYKTRGFLIDKGFMTYQALDANRAADLSDFITQFTNTPKTVWDSDFLTFPLIKKKYDLLQSYMMTTYGINLQAIGDATY